MHSEATETQVLVGTDWIADVSISRMTLLVSEAINRHRQKPHTSLEIILHVGSRGSINVEFPLAEGFRSSLMGRESTKPVSNYLEALLHRLCISAVIVE